MKIEIELNDLYCENGQWKVHLSSKYNGLKTNELLKKIMLPECRCLRNVQIENEEYWKEILGDDPYKYPEFHSFCQNIFSNIKKEAGGISGMNKIIIKAQSSGKMYETCMNASHQVRNILEKGKAVAILPVEELEKVTERNKQLEQAVVNLFIQKELPCPVCDDDYSGQDCTCYELPKAYSALRRLVEKQILEEIRRQNTIHISELPEGYIPFICIRCENSFVRDDVPIKSFKDVICEKCKQK
jgi:hypothetical protein